VLLRTKFLPIVALLVVVGLTAGACGGGGGGGHSYKAGTPAATGVPPDCSAVPLDLAKKTLGLDLTGPIPGTRADGVACTFHHAEGGSATEAVQLNGNVTQDSFAFIKNGLKSANNPVNNIHGWGDEAYAAVVRYVVVENIFAVRKGHVSVVIQSTADYDHIKKLMKAVLAKL
jgi:hypothetical protein